MSKIQIYVHGENSREAKLIEVLENASIKDLINDFQKEFTNTSNSEEIEIFLEDDESPVDKHHSVSENGIKKRGHIHCHRCKKIAVTVFYNGEDKSFHFPPSATTKSIMNKVVKAFNIKESDAGDYLLKLEDKTILQPSDHIGSFVTFPHCQIKLFLTPTQPVLG